MTYRLPREGTALSEEAEAKSVLPTPEDVVRKGIGALPTTIGGALLTLYSIFQWVSVPTSLLSQLSELRVIVDFWRGLYGQLVALRPVLDVLANAGASVLVGWRAFTAPVRELVVALLPHLVIPQLVVDLVVIALICAPSFVRLQWLNARFDLLYNGIQDDLRRTRGNALTLLFMGGAVTLVARPGQDGARISLPDDTLKHIFQLVENDVTGGSKDALRLPSAKAHLNRAVLNSAKMQKVVRSRRGALRFLLFAVSLSVLAAVFVVFDLFVYRP
jgi:hypothetical protein